MRKCLAREPSGYSQEDKDGGRASASLKAPSNPASYGDVSQGYRKKAPHGSCNKRMFNSKIRGITKIKNRRKMSG
jgi:hypothetical protein